MSKIFYIILTFLTLSLIFVNCGRMNSAAEPNTVNNINSLTDVWNAPVGELVQGAAISEGWTDLRVLDSPVNVDGGWTDSAAISNNGTSLYFVYSRFGFSQVVDNATFIVTGPSREGMTGNYMKNFRADLTPNGWVVSMLGAPFNTDPNMHESSLSANASENLIVWVRWDATSTKATMFFSTKGADGKWSEAIQVPASVQNPNCSSDNPFVVGDINTGVDLYFESDRTDLNCSSGGAKRHIYHSYYNPSSNSFSAVEKVAGLNGVQLNDEDMQPFFTKDKKQAFWTATRHDSSGNPTDYGIYTAELVGNAYMNARPIIRPNFVSPYTGKLTFIGEANVVERPEGWLIYMICGIAQNEGPGNSKGSQLKICRMKKPKTSEVLAAKKINTSGWSDSPFISRDGQRLYFMYSRWDFSPWIRSGGSLPPVLAGPDRPGLHKSSANSFEESDIYMSQKNPDGTWSEPVNLGLNGSYGDSSGMEFNNGNSFIWLRGNGSGNNIVISNKNADGTWGVPVDLGAGINMVGKIQDNPHISPDGNGVWFTSDRSGGLGGKDIWFSLKNAGNWGAPINSGAPFNTVGDEDQFWFSPVTNEIYWNTSQGLKKCISNGSTCSATPETVSIPGCDYVAEVSMPDDGNSIYFGCGSNVTGRVSIMYSTKQSNGSWGVAKSVDE